jgi:8-amino-7-oxononanoate synthase
VNPSMEWMREELRALQEKSNYRELKETRTEYGSWITYCGRKVLNLSSNNYLGLSHDPELLRLFLNKKVEGIGATASRLVVGNHPLYQQAEEALARSKGMESALIFPSGYMANVGTISAVVGREDTVFSDRLNHASLIDGIQVSRARAERYHHNDMDHLESLLRKSEGKRGRKLIVTDTVFSMDGDIAPLKELVQLKERYGAMLMVDEAHSGGVYGPHGEGLCHELGLQDRVDIQMGTFSKAYGCYGAYVIGSSMLKEYLVNRARSFIFTTGLPPMVLSSILLAIERVHAGKDLREQLQRNAAFLRVGLQKLGFDTTKSETQIIPIVLGDNARTLSFSQALLEEGIAGVAIRPPTVPEGEARIRFTVMSTHTEEELSEALDRMKRAWRREADDVY